MALLVGFVLDQQVTVQKAFSGPLEIRERIGSLDADTLADADLETVFREKPGIHRYPGSMAPRAPGLAVPIRDEDGSPPPPAWGRPPGSGGPPASAASLPG